MISSVYEISYIVQWVVICVLVVGLAALYSAFGALTRQLSLAGPPAFDVLSLGPTIGDEVELNDLPHELSVSVDGVRAWIFATPGCTECARTKAALQNVAPDNFEGRVAIVVNGPRQRAESWVKDLPSWISFVPDEEDRLFRSFNINATPFYVLLDENGRCITKGATEAALLTAIHESHIRPSAAELQNGKRFEETSSSSRA